MYAPIPFSAAINSAATMRIIAIAAVIRILDRIAGKEAGNTIFLAIEIHDKLNDWPIRIKLRSTLSIAPYVAIIVGNNVPNNIKFTLDSSPIPNQMINKGRSAIFGTGKIAATIGARPDRIVENSPIAKPKIIPNIVPSVQPRDRRVKLAPKCRYKSPVT